MTTFFGFARDTWFAAVLGMSIAACGGGASTDSHDDAAFPDVTTPIKLPKLKHPPDASKPSDAADAGKPQLEAGSSPVDAAHDTSNTRDASDAGADVQDATDAANDAFHEAVHTLPVITNNGGPVLAAPIVVTVTFADDTQRALIEQLDGYLVGSNWLQTVGPEYGIGLGTNQNAELASDAPSAIDDTGIQRLIESLVRAGTIPGSDAGVSVPQLPFSDDAGTFDGGATAADGGPVSLPPVIYMMYFPSTTAITVDGTALCTFSGGGYHSQTSLSSYGRSFVYAVVSPCDGSDPAQFVQAASHEFIEAATDPVQSMTAYSIRDLEDPWSYFGGEVGDLCSLLMPQWSEGGFTGIQRVYSNSAAKHGGDPCIPSPETYYGTDVEPSTATPIAAGGSATYNITGWSEAPVPSWGLSALLYINQPTNFNPTMTVSETQLNNGQTATLTVNVPAGTASGSYAFLLLYSAQTDSDYTTSLIEIYVP